MNNDFSPRIDIPNITRNPEIVQPEPNPAIEAPTKHDPEVQPDKRQK